MSEEYMCPNCVTPWKCNGPHEPDEFEAAPPDPLSELADQWEMQPGDKGGVRYRTIVADPPWRYSNARGTQTRAARGRRAVTAEDNYPTMTNADIMALPVREQAADQAHLYLWVTNPKLYGGRGRKGEAADAILPIDIMDAWGFEYVTCLTWQKVGPPGLGFYFRGMTEHVLFGVRGGLQIPPDRRESNVIIAPRTVHSAKPDRFYEMVERVSPGPYLELFARRRRYGWDVWGNEAPEEAASQAEMGLSA